VIGNALAADTFSGTWVITAIASFHVYLFIAFHFLLTFIVFGSQARYK
jgi:hypothetical protein